MWSVQILVDPPAFNDLSGMALASEKVLVETFFSQAPLKLATKPCCMVLPGEQVTGYEYDA